MSSKSAGITISVDPSERALPYSANKQRRSVRIWRLWNRLSKLQRYLLFCSLALIVIFILLKSQSSDQTKTHDEPKTSHEQVKKQHQRTPEDDEEEEIVIGEEVGGKKGEQVERILAADGEGGTDEEIGNSADGENQVQVDRGPKEVPEKGDAVERMQEARVMPRPKTFTGPDNFKQKKVVGAFQHAWDAYKRHAWGHDELKPISRSFKEWFHIGLTLVDSLDTMYIMGLTQEFSEARKWIKDSLTFEKDVDVNLFEITIRAVGGLLSTYHLSGDDVFREKALDLGERLMAAFSTHSGVPHSDVNLKKRTSHAPKWGPDSSSAEVTTLQLEFRDLSYVSGDNRFNDAAFRVSEHFHKLEKKDGLIPIFINAITGEFRQGAAISFGARGDSYYEYLLKQWIQDGKRTDWLRADFLDAMAGAKKHLLKTSNPNSLTFLGELFVDRFSPKMDALACFLPGSLALAYMNGLPAELLEMGEKLLYTCYQMYNRMPTRLAPEIVYFNTGSGSDVPEGTVDIHVRDNDAHALLRPEFVESLFYMYRLTKNHTYQEWGWQVFQAIEQYAKIPTGGYASLEDVRNTKNPAHRDHMESFLLSETFKYLYLLLGTDQSLLPLDEYVFNSEAHPLPIRKVALT